LVDCDDLRLGGTLTAAGITGGTSINSTALGVADWSGLFGHSGLSLTSNEVSGRPGGWLTGDGLGKPRQPLLNMQITRMGINGGQTSATPQEQLWANTDVFLTKLAAPVGNYLEVDLPDGTSRFLHVTAWDAASIAQPRTVRRMSVPLYSAGSYWKAGGQESTDTIAGADAVVVGGGVSVYDPILVFAGDGTFTNSTAGWSITITGSTGAVTVNCGARTVTQAGIPADQLLTVTDREWGWFVVGSNTVTANVSVVITWRNQWN